ncbi:hypothetical protein OAB03_01980, partial [Planktomarina temperata]|nr:hypothetical protein [Planktomarina temperata]
MKKKTIYFPIEHTYRELKSKVYLASLLTERGYRCYLGSGAEIMRLLVSQKNSLLFHKSTCVDYVEPIKKMGHKIVFLDEEIGFAIPHKGRVEAVAWRYRTCKPGDYQVSFVISEQIAELIARTTQGNLKTAVTGWPRFDLMNLRAQKRGRQSVR